MPDTPTLLFVLRTRQAVIFTIVLTCALFAAAYPIKGSASGAWEGLGVPALSPSFADLRTITHSIDCRARGVDPYTSGACDPWGRLYNYPSVWLDFSYLGLSSRSTDAVGIALIVVVCVAFFLMFETRSKTTSVMTILALGSPPVLLSLERGNGDVLIFCALVIGAAILRSQKARALGLPVLIVALATLKLYPIAGAIVFLKRGRIPSVAVPIAAAVSVCFFVGFRELHAIATNTPQVSELSYGSRSIALTIFGAILKFRRISSFSGLPNLYVMATAAFDTAGLAAAGYVVSRHGDRISRFLPKTTSVHETRHEIAIMCCAIFVLTFALGSSWIYRLIFLTGALQLFLYEYDRRRDRALLVIPAAMLIFMWLSRVPHSALKGVAVLDSAVSFVVFVFALIFLGLELARSVRSGDLKPAQERGDALMPAEA